MPSFRWLRWLATGGTLLGIVAAIVAIALHSGDSPGIALAITATPEPWYRTYRTNVQLPEDVIVASTVQVAATASIRNPADLKSGVLFDQVSYSLRISDSENADNESVLELMSPSRVSVEDVTDGAEWELRALRRGRAEILVSVRFRTRSCPSCFAFFTTSTLARRVVTVEPLPGDVDCNAAANVIDAALVLQLAAELIDELPCEDVADVNQDGSVNALDATLILQYAAGLLDSLSP